MKRERIMGWMGMAAVAILVGWNGAALAADPANPTLADRVKALEDKMAGQKFSLSGLLGIEFSGYLDATYEFNFNQPDSGANGLRVFDYSQANGFELHAAQLAFRRAPASDGDLAKRAGFGVKLLFGDDAQVIAPYPQNLNPINSRSLVIGPDGGTAGKQQRGANNGGAGSHALPSS